MARIFLSYRRDDSAGHTGRIFDHLTSRFGAGRVFMDVEGIDAGDNFADSIEASIAGCDTVVAVIGKRWAGEPDVLGKKRIQDPNDYVRREIETALRLGVELVPVLVGGASFPATEDLPDSIAEMGLRNALELDDKTFRSSAERLIEVLEKTSARNAERKRLGRLAELEKKQLTKAGDASAATKEKQNEWWTKVRRLLLFYAPARKATWILHVFFYYLLLCAIVVPVATIGEGDIGSVGFAVLLFVGMLVVLRAIAAVIEPSRTVGRRRRWWLLYKPPRAGTSALHLVFLLMLASLFFWATVMLMATFFGSTGTGRAMLVVSATVWIVLTFAVREVAAARDPLRPRGAEADWFARLFYLWRPRRSTTWFPRIVFYLSAFLFMIFAPLVFAGQDSNLHWGMISRNRSELTQAVLYLIIAFSARGWAKSAEAWRIQAEAPVHRSAVRALLLLDFPSRPLGWLPRLLFWGAAALLLGTLLRRSWIVAALDCGTSTFSSIYLAALMVVLAASSQRWSLLYPSRADVASV